MPEQKSVHEILKDAMEAVRGDNLEAAATLVEGVLARDGDNLKALDLGGFIRFFQNRYEEAEEFCRRALSVKPGHPYALKGLGLCLARQGQLERGCESLEKAINARPDWFDPYWDLAVVLKEAKLYDRAKQVLERGKTNVPSKKAEFEKFEAQLHAALKG